MAVRAVQQRGVEEGAKPPPPPPQQQQEEARKTREDAARRLKRARHEDLTREEVSPTKKTRATKRVAMAKEEADKLAPSAATPLGEAVVSGASVDAPLIGAPSQRAASAAEPSAEEPSAVSLEAALRAAMLSVHAA